MKGTKPSVLLIDDDPEFTAFLTEMLASRYEFTVVHDGEAGVQTLVSQRPDVVLLDIVLGDDGFDGFDVLQIATETAPDLPVIMLTGQAGVGEVVRAIKLGAYHYITKPPDFTELCNLVERCASARNLHNRAAALEDEIARLRGADGLEQTVVARDPVSLAVVAEARKVAPTDATVLITGPSGAGKEMLAWLLHQESPRRDGPFVAVNCTAIDNDRVESELFGHVKGAFTGATADAIGRFEAAHGGVLFLDEIGDISPQMQAKLLRVLETRVFERVGETRPRRSDVRVVAATNRDLVPEIAAGRFREDLYHRLRVFPLHLPSLRERRGDILPLADHFLERFTRDYKKTIDGFSSAAARHLHGESWPGNVRELRNVVERAVIVCDAERVELRHVVPAAPGVLPLDRPLGQLREERTREFETQYVIAQLRRFDGHMTKAATASGMSVSALSKLCRKLGIAREEFRAS